MSVETQTFRAQRIDLRERRQRLDLACRNTLDVLRSTLFPYTTLFRSVEICEDQAVDDMLKFAQQVRELRDTDTRIKILSAQLEMD